jgi:hypothetical protein
MLSNGKLLPPQLQLPTTRMTTATLNNDNKNDFIFTTTRKVRITLIDDKNIIVAK